MHAERFIIAVPGRDDRAFYKILVKNIAYINKLGYIDLDSKTRQDEKRRLIDTIAPQQSPRLARVSAAKLVRDNVYKEVVIWPLEGERGKSMRRAWDLLAYQLGLEPPTLNYFIVIRDAEQESVKDALHSFLESLAARHGCVMDSERETGNYYILIHEVCGKPVDVLLVIQGLGEQHHLHQCNDATRPRRLHYLPQPRHAPHPTQ